MKVDGVWQQKRLFLKGQNLTYEDFGGPEGARESFQIGRKFLTLKDRTSHFSPRGTHPEDYSFDALFPFPQVVGHKKLTEGLKKNGFFYSTVEELFPFSGSLDAQKPYLVGKDFSRSIGYVDDVTIRLFLNPKGKGFLADISDGYQVYHGLKVVGMNLEDRIHEFLERIPIQAVRLSLANPWNPGDFSEKRSYIMVSGVILEDGTHI